MNLEYQIKLATDADMVDVFKLSNDPDIRQNSFNQEPISIEKHKEWFKNKVNSKDCIFYIIRNNYNELMGYSRFDKNLGQNHFVISVGLNSKYRGKGLGRKIIKQTSCMVETEKHSEIIAYVKENNYISLESFRKSGYDIITKETINGTPCYKLKFSCSINRDAIYV